MQENFEACAQLERLKAIVQSLESEKKQTSVELIDNRKKIDKLHLKKEKLKEEKKELKRHANDLREQLDRLQTNAQTADIQRGEANQLLRDAKMEIEG